MALIGIVMLPFYVEALGVEAYGLVGLFIAFQSLLTLLDFGLSATLMREAARFRASAASAESVGALLRFIEALFLLLAACAAIGTWFGAPAIVDGWLKNEGVSNAEAIQAIRQMGLVLALRLMAIPYRALLTGFEDLRWLGIFNASITTFRSVLVMAPLWWLAPTLQTFFSWQTAAGAIEVLLLMFRAYRSSVPLPPFGLPGLAAVAPHWRFSLSLAAGAAIWTVMTNVDKAVLSGWLPLSEYSRFSIAVTAAGGVVLAIGPIGLASGPRFASLHAAGNDDAADELYGQVTQLTACIAFAAALTLAFFPTEVLWAWTGNSNLAQQASLVLSLYALGNGVLAIGALPFQLQMAAGQLRLHLTGMALFITLLLPLLWIATRRYGMDGPGMAWLATNLAFVLLWLPVLHRRFLGLPHTRWLLRDVIVVLLPPAIVGALLRYALPWTGNRLLTVFELLTIGSTLLLAAFIGSWRLRSGLLRWLRPADGLGEGEHVRK